MYQEKYWSCQVTCCRDDFEVTLAGGNTCNMIMNVHVKIYFTSFSCTSSTSTCAGNFAEVSKCKPPTSNNTLQLLKILTNTKKELLSQNINTLFLFCEKYISHKTHLSTSPQSTICTFYLVI